MGAASNRGSLFATGSMWAPSVQLALPPLQKHKIGRESTELTFVVEQTSSSRQISVIFPNLLIATRMTILLERRSS